VLSSVLINTGNLPEKGKRIMWNSKEEPKKKKILIIDDEKDFCQMVKMKLEAHQFDVDIALTGEEGLELVRSARPDLVLLDVIMPAPDGYQVLQRLKSDPEAKNIPVVMLTARTEVADIDRAIQDGAFDYVIKPLDAQILLRKVQKVLG
jgi:DNA-binding response OmpR family regulator